MIKTINITAGETTDLYQYLSAAITPRPIAFVSTIDSKGNKNLSPFSFFNVFSINPPILVFSPVRRVRNNTSKHTLDNLHQIKIITVLQVKKPVTDIKLVILKLKKLGFVEFHQLASQERSFVKIYFELFWC